MSKLTVEELQGILDGPSQCILVLPDGSIKTCGNKIEELEKENANLIEKIKECDKQVEALQELHGKECGDGLDKNVIIRHLGDSILKEAREAGIANVDTEPSISELLLLLQDLVDDNKRLRFIGSPSDNTHHKMMSIAGKLEPGKLEGCLVCGSKLCMIRGKYPKEPKREVCPTCMVEKLEDMVSQFNHQCASKNIK